MTVDFAVRRRNPELVGPARPTPRETKRLSDIDDQAGLRWHVPFVLFYRGLAAGEADDSNPPATVIHRALGEALVPYYPLAGRLREVEGRKLVVDCTGEGVLFVEADADVRLAELEAVGGLTPPFPSMDQLLFDVEGSGDVLNCPLLLIQVTRLRCGGFVLALRLNHTMCDAEGIVQFMSAVGELARGLPAAPTVAPVWFREALDARRPPRPSFPHPEYDPAPPPTSFPADMVMRTFTFGPADIAAIKNVISSHQGGNINNNKPTTFEALGALIWRARTAALDIPAGEDARLVIAASVRGVPDLGLPAGYYGNACVYPSAVLAAGELLGGSLGDAAALVREAKKAAASAEYARSTADLMALHGRPFLAAANALVVSDNRRAGFERVDFGWGQPVYGGPAAASFVVSFVVAVRNGDGKDAVAVPVVLPRSAMDRFASDIGMLVKS